MNTPLPTSRLSVRKARGAVSILALLLTASAAQTLFAAYHEHATQQQDNAAASEQQSVDKSDQRLANAGLQGKLETVFLLNRHLNNYSLDTELAGNRATLCGTVDSDNDPELAEQVALAVDGIDAVDNQLKVDKARSKAASAEDTGERSFSQFIDDATTTAMVKSRLPVNSATRASSIDVDTRKGSVILAGKVASDEKKPLAAKIAENTDGVAAVLNKLEVQ